MDIIFPLTQNGCAIPTNVCSILAFGLLPFTPTNCREALITMVQVMPELASIIEVGIAKECKLHM